MDSKEVFISYSSKQSEIAFAVCDYLEKHDIRCWVAPRDIPSGSNYTLEIPSGIQQCKVMVLIFSETATQSQWITLEVMSAVNNNMTIIPFRIEDFPVNSNMGLYFMLQKSQWIDAFPKFEDQLENLRKDIEKIIGKKSLNLNPTDPIDQFQLGMNYFSGVYVQKDMILARKWFTVAAKQGHVKSMKMLGDYYSREGRNAMGKLYYTKAAENGDSQSQYILGNKFFEEGKIPEAISWFEKSVDTGSFEALEALAELYYYGKDINTDYTKSYTYCEKAILTESAKAYYLMGRMNLYGEGREINYPLALEYLDKAKTKDLKVANYELGIIYENGLGVEKDLEKAILYYKDAHTGNSFKKIAEIRDKNKKEFLTRGILEEIIETTQYYYTAGLLYEEEKNFSAAVEMYEIAAEKGSVDAMARYGAILCDQENYEAGLAWLEKAATQNNALAYTFLGNCYFEGRYYKEDKHKAFKHYNKANDLGDIMGKYYLALFNLTQNIEGCSRKKGMELLLALYNFCSLREDIYEKDINANFYGRNYYTISEKSSLLRGKEDNPFHIVLKSSEHLGENKVNLVEDISIILGHCYHYGIGVEKNYKKAIYYFNQLWVGENKFVAVSLGDIYSEGGFGISRDFQSALRDYDLSTNSIYAYIPGEGWKINYNVEIEKIPVEICFEVGWRFISALGARQDMSHAIEQLVIASKAKYKPAIALLYNLYIINYFVEPNQNLQKKYLDLAEDNDIHYIEDFIIPKEEESNVQREIDYYLNLLKIFNETFGEIDYHCLIVLERLASLYINIKQYYSALEITDKALDIQLKLHGEQDEATAVWFSNLAYVYGLMKDYENERNNIQKGIEILKSIEDKDAGYLVNLYRKLARCYSNLKEFEREEEAAQNALELSLKSFGEKNPCTVHSIETMAESAIHLENYEKALDLYLKALSIYQSGTGEESQSTAYAYHSISDVYWSMENLEEALNYEYKALQIYKHLHGEMSPECELLYENIGILSFKLGKYPDSINYFSKAYSIEKESEIKIGIGFYAHKLGIVYSKMGDKESAKEKFEEALRLLPEDNQDAIDARLRLEELEKNDLKESEQ